jgi:hypothetical protein
MSPVEDALLILAGLFSIANFILLLGLRGNSKRGS